MNYKIINTAIVALAISSNAVAQQTNITGKVIDPKTNEPMIGATINLQGTTNISTVSDIDGNFTFFINPGTYNLSVEYLGYKKYVQNGLNISSENNPPIQIILEEEKKQEQQLNEVVVQGVRKQQSINSILNVQKNSLTITQGISAEQIKRSPDKNTGEALKRISGLSLMDGKYIVVRGLSDRYNQTMTNGALLSSTEADRKTFSYDIFPSNLVDNILINKASTPNMSGEFAGGVIQVNTKDIPNESFFDIQIGSGFNTQSIGKNFYFQPKGGLDFLGLDDGTRALPDQYPTKSSVANMSNAERVNLAKTFKNDWAYQEKNAPLNLSLQASGGFNTFIKNKKFGGTLGISYNKSHSLQKNTRTLYNLDGTKQRILDYKENAYNQNILIGALANFSLVLNKNNALSFKNIYTINANNQTLLRTGRNNDIQAEIDAYQMSFKTTQYVTNQLIGKHSLSSEKTNLNWIIGHTRLYENVPNLRRMEYRQYDGTQGYIAAVQNSLASLNHASRFYSKLNDYNLNANIDLDHSFTMNNIDQKLRFGYAAQYKNRTFNSRALSMVNGNHELLQLGMNDIFDPQNINTNGFSMNELTDKDYDYDANSLLNAGYVMLENKFEAPIDVVWGLRVEHYNQQVNGFRSNRPVNLDNNQIDFLPSVNLTYHLKQKTNLRFSASQTVIRPEFRELSPFAFYDFELLGSVNGNPDLKRTKIINVDAKYELFPNAGETFSVGVFYKHFKNPIEQLYNETGVSTSSYTFNNASSATTYGFELDFRKNLGKLFKQAFWNPFTIAANFSLIQNNVVFDVDNSGTNGENTTIERPMQGQSPYVINASLGYQKNLEGFSANVMFNMIGRRIYMVGNQRNPNIWEAPLPMLDAQIAQGFLKGKGQVKLSASNILNRTNKFYQDINENNKYDAAADNLRISKLSGTTISVGVSYKIK